MNLGFNLKGVRAYYLLALLITTTIFASSYLGQHLQKFIGQAITFNNRCHSASEAVSKLSFLASHLNAPGNDVFENGEVEAMEQRLREIEISYADQFKRALEALVAVEKGPLGKQLVETHYFQHEMLAHAHEIFKSLHRQDHQKAGVSMAQMDQSYAKLIGAIYDIQSDLLTIQRSQLDREYQDSLGFKKYEKLLTFAGVFLLLLMVVYGRWISQQYVGYQSTIEKSLQELSNQKFYFESILNSAADAIITINGEGLIMQCNLATTKLLGYAIDDLMGQNIKMIMPEEHEKQHDQYLKNYLNTNIRKVIGIPREVQAKKKDGTFIVVEIAIDVVKIESSRENQFFVGIIRDIHDRKEQERLTLDAQKKAEDASRAKGEFLANMSHEIRTPMNGILGSANLLSDTSLNAEQKELTQMIVHSTRSLLVIINDILDFSKIEAGKMTLENISMDYGTVVNDVILLMHEQAQGKGIDLIKNFPLEYPKMLLGDPHRLRQILLNLLSNSVKFTSDGQVTLSVEFNRVNAQAFSIKTIINDTGIGMTPDQMKKLFNSFSQADTSTSRKYGGTGLGTTISKKLIEHMGGRIWAESEIGVGSTFTFEVELLVSNEPYVNKETVTRPKRNYQKTIILAEDNLINQKVAMRTLEKLGLKILLAQNGKEAVDLALKESHELILMDIQMPEMNGVEATLSLLAGGYNKPIIALTANVMENDVTLYHQAGMSGHIPKPLNIHQLILTLDVFLGLDPNKSTISSTDA
jgi:PAS domain S-box-containing protein